MVGHGMDSSSQLSAQYYYVIDLSHFLKIVHVLLFVVLVKLTNSDTTLNIIF